MTRFKLLFLAIALVQLSACASVDRLKSIGEAPDLAPTDNPARLFSGREVILPMPTTVNEQQKANSLWRTGAKSLFRDHRARNTGDIVTIVIDIDDRARLNNSTERSRANGEAAALPALSLIHI